MLSWNETGFTSVAMTTVVVYADQFQAFALPELLEDSLEEGDTKCIAFNRWGTILAGKQQILVLYQVAGLVDDLNCQVCTPLKVYVLCVSHTLSG